MAVESHADESMSEFLKCECSHCGQPIEYPSEGTGMVIPCPSCQSPVTLNPESKPNPRKDNEGLKKPARSSLGKLTKETIKAKTKSGETPLHRAAKNGQFREIPSHLLSIKLFKAKNDAGETPLHLAAKHGHLDQVPRQFLTRETMTVRIGDGTYLTGSGKVAYTDTPLHMAAADQIPKQFLTPEFLSLRASGYQTTLLHCLAYQKRLDLVPQEYANSEIWNLKDYVGRTARDVLQEVKKRENYVSHVRSEVATEKQKAKLQWFGYPVKDRMTKGEASDAIDQCIRQNPEKEREYYDRPATKEQIAQLHEHAKADRNLAGMFEEMEEEESTLTYGEAKDLLRDSKRDAQRREIDRITNPPDESQVKKLEELGFKLDTRLDEIITGADLDDILGLKAASPRLEDLSLFEQHGITSFQGDGLAAFALGDLIRSFGGSAQPQNRKKLNYSAACQAALNDPDYQNPKLTRDEEGFLAFAWPKSKIREWLRAAKAG
jgi:Ankyrin repeats (3 copies)